MTTSLEKKIYYGVPQGYLINDILRNKISGDDRFIFTELANASQRRIQMYCYGITSEYCWGQDKCYYCTIILFINDEKRKGGTFRPCEILDQGRKSCRFDSCKHCRNDWNIHYKL